jgi:hypothetical protein
MIAGALVLVLGLSTPTQAQAPRQTQPNSMALGWDGRPITRRCHADVGDLEGLKATLIEHEKARSATMLRSGLEVEGRAAARAPRPRGEEAQRAPLARERPSSRLTQEARSLLLPQALALNLSRLGATRLLILPVSDIGFVPFAALPLDGEWLIPVCPGAVARR